MKLDWLIQEKKRKNINATQKHTMRQKDTSNKYIRKTNLNQSFSASSADSNDRTSTWSLLIHCKPYSALPTA